MVKLYLGASQTIKRRRKRIQWPTNKNKQKRSEKRSEKRRGFTLMTAETSSLMASKRPATILSRLAGPSLQQIRHNLVRSDIKRFVKSWNREGN
jgi:hypothetical protein